MRLLSYFLPSAPQILVYMLQQKEYDSYAYADWVNTVPNLRSIQRRQHLDLTARARLTLFVGYALWTIPLIVGVVFSIISGHLVWLLISLFAPLFAVIGLFLFNGVFGSLIVQPLEARQFLSNASYSIMVTQAVTMIT